MVKDIFSMVMDTLTIASFVILMIYKALLMFSSKVGGGIALRGHKKSTYEVLFLCPYFNQHAFFVA